MSGPRGIRVIFRGAGGGPDGKGLLAPDPRVRTLCRVLVSYPDVRHILPDHISLEPTTETRTLETVAKFLGRQAWLVKSVEVE